mmetsp:Transcript_38989/g.81604  ORF Transcript_38989/g.81604 Transcript_38989/m.81604 type:complete len:469 (-) Transcript_38989:332-1738(-)
MGAQTFNRYNLFYRLERHLLLHVRGAVTNKDDDVAPTDSEASKYATLELPPLPSRYNGFYIPKLWFVSSKGGDKKRSHRKSHGLASFTEIARIVATNWKAIDQETMNFVTIVSNILKAYVDEHGIKAGNSHPKKKKAVKSSPSRILSDGPKEGEIQQKKAQTVSQHSHMSSPTKSPPPPPPAPDPLPSSIIGTGLAMKVDKNEHLESLGHSRLTIFDEPPLSSDGITTKVNGKSKTPQASNHPVSEPMQVDSSVLTSDSASVTPTSSFTNGSNQFATNMNQSFLRERLEAGVISNSHTHSTGVPEQRQNTSNLLANPNSTGAQHHIQQMMSTSSSSLPGALCMSHQRSASTSMHLPPISSIGICTDVEIERLCHHQYQRRASSAPDSSTDVEAMGLQRQLYQQQRRASNVTLGSCPNSAGLQRRVHPQQRRCSSYTLGSSNKPVKELDIGDDEIFAMWSCGSQGRGNL